MKIPKKNGRPRIDENQEEALSTFSVRMSFRLVRLSRKIGGGNYAEGLRISVERTAADIEFMESLDKKK